MKFEEFLELVPKLKKSAVDGVESHLKMIPPNRAELMIMAKKKYASHKNAAVLALIYPKKDQTLSLALILRKTYKGVHSNQVGFPGGKVENSDASLKETALRETEEEIGVKKNVIEVIASLTEVYVPPSNYMVHPFLGYSSSPLVFSIQESEVEQMLEIPFSELLNDDNVIHSKQQTATGHELFVPAFKLDDFDVWGATAMILSELKDLCKKNLES